MDLYCIKEQNWWHGVGEEGELVDSARTNDMRTLLPPFRPFLPFDHSLFILFDQPINLLQCIHSFFFSPLARRPL